MHLKKLITVFRLIPATEIEALSQFVQSPYFKVPAHARALYTYLLPLYPVFPEAQITTTAIKTHAQNLSTPAKQSRAGSHLLETLYRFMAEQQWQKSKAETNRYRLKGFKELQLADAFKKEYEYEMQQLNENPMQDYDTFYHRHLLTEFLCTGFGARLNRTQQNNLEPLIKTLDEFHALKKLRCLCEQLNRQRVLGVPAKNEQVPPLLQTLQEFTTTKYPYVYLFVNVYRMMEEPTFEESSLYYRMLKQFIQNKGSSLPVENVSEVADYTLNYCLFWANRGHEKAGIEYLWWIEWKRENNLLLQNGKLLPVTFTNLISTAVESQLPPAKISKLINSYASCLPAHKHPSLLPFAQGLYQYALKNYKEAIRFFLQSESKDDVVFNCIIRRWQFMCLYEFDADDIDALSNHITSFQKYLLRHKRQLKHLPPSYQSFTYYALGLLQSTSHKAGLLIKEIEDGDYFKGSVWLKQQLNLRSSSTIKQARQKITA